ncbi:hydrolase of the alpha/beta superfamily [Labilithrix luteola]|uniref:Hydrolase of the alpha/beta superfamily n=1 Tax=Labilithrix luteola TaxID=1391654 RepID=A0A0K1PY25_9BACT|nr:hydrolase of the alpha/beta superfamily [Labilithrix luteola]
MVKEQALQLGADGHLVGVLARPSAPPRVAGDLATPAVLLLNAGVIHRVGPHRLHVILARRLAARGMTSLRLDLSGIGDSRPVPGALSFRESAVVDTRSAMDRLAADGERRFVLFGLCSGSDNALATAAVDERVVGLVLLDPPAYPTARSRARKLAARVRGLGTARAVLTWGGATLARRLRARVDAARGRAAGEDDAVTGGRGMPAIAEYRARLGALVERGVAILMVFSGALGERYNATNQLFELFPELRGRIEVAYFPGANHTFTERDAQAQLVETVCVWMERRR